MVSFAEPAVDDDRRVVHDRDAGRLFGMHLTAAARDDEPVSSPRPATREHGDECEAAHHALTFAWSTWPSSAFSTLPTCWLTIGWKTRWPMLPIGPATWMSATHLMLVRSPSTGVR